jgi:Flp pilus assembly pilin Flp
MGIGTQNQKQGAQRPEKPGAKTMVKLYERIRVLASEDRAQDMVEYALLAGFIAVAAGALLPNIADSINIIFSRVTSLLSQAAK